MRKSTFFIPSLVLAALTVSSQNNQNRPNMVFIIADDLSWNDLGCYGNRDVKTPNIDQLASKGIRFTNFFLTASSCSPSRNSIITGRYPHNTGAAELHTEPPLNMVSFPEILKQQGYYTALSGKFHMGKYARRGFDVVNDDKSIGDGGEEMWIETLRNRCAEKPFMMWFAALDAHRNWGSNKFSGTHESIKLTLPFYLVNSEETKTDLAKYYDEITRFDHYVGQVLAELKKQKVLDNTIVIVMADNGRAFPHSKTRVNDRGLKTPFIAFWPKGLGTKSRVCNSLVSSIDIAPTLLELAVVKIPETVQGVSFGSLLKNPEKPFRNYVFAEHNWHDYEAHERMVRSNDFLYILNSRPNLTNLGPADVVGSPSFKDLLEGQKNGALSPEQSEIFIQPRPAEELYENSTDPEQFDNVAAKPKFQEKLVELRFVLKNWMAETADNIPDNLTPDWYEKPFGNVKKTVHGQRGEMPGQKIDAVTLKRTLKIF